ncbi:MAG: hypothetical protein ACI84K_000837 [Pseudohongiellaceae bacterium]|jgi:hypothetical protein
MFAVIFRAKAAAQELDRTPWYDSHHVQVEEIKCEYSHRAS